MDSYTVYHVLETRGCAKGISVQTILEVRLPGGQGVVKEHRVLPRLSGEGD